MPELICQRCASNKNLGIKENQTTTITGEKGVRGIDIQTKTKRSQLKNNCNYLLTLGIQKVNRDSSTS